MEWNLIDKILLNVGIIILIAIIDTLLVIIKKDQYIRWINFLGIILVLGIVINEIFGFLNQLRYFLRRL